jgi:hypothetical protein
MHDEMVKIKVKHFFLIYGYFLWSVRCATCEPPTLTSDKPVVFDSKTKSSLAEGNAEFNHKDLCLQAHRIYFFPEEAKAIAEEQVKVTRNALRLVASWGQYYLRDKSVEMPKFRLELKGHGIAGSNLRGPIEHLRADDVDVYYNGKSWIGLNVHARTGTLYGNRYLELQDALFRVGCVPILFTPYYRHDFEESTVRWKSDVGLIKRSKDYGRYVRNDILFNMGWSVKPGLMADYYRKREFLVGGILEYDTEDVAGRFKGARIHDADASSRTLNGQTLENPRFFVDWQHRQNLGEQTDLVTQIEWRKDANVIKDFRPDDHDGTRQHPDNFAEVAHRAENSITSITARYRFNNFQRIQERLPEIRFEYLPVRLKDTPAYYQWGVGFSHLREKPIVGATKDLQEKELRRADIFTGISAPCDLSSWCTVTPVAGARTLKYWGLQGAAHKDYERFLGQVGFDLRFKFYGEYMFENKYWNIHNFRHLCTPVVQYRYLPNGHAGRGHIPAIDRENDEVKTSFQEIDLLNRRDCDNLNDMHLLRVGLENYLYTNYNTGSPKQWFKCNFYQDFRLKRMDNQTTLSDFFVDTEWSPASFFSWNLSARVDPIQKKLNEANTTLSFHENDLWRISCTHSYTAKTENSGVTNQDSLSVSYRLNARNMLTASLSVDAHTPDMISQTYTWSTIAANTWKVDTQFKWKKRSKNSTEDNWEIRWIIMLYEG